MPNHLETQVELTNYICSTKEKMVRHIILHTYQSGSYGTTGGITLYKFVAWTCDILDFNAIFILTCGVITYNAVF